MNRTEETTLESIDNKVTVLIEPVQQIVKQTSPTLDLGGLGRVKMILDKRQETIKNILSTT